MKNPFKTQNEITKKNSADNIPVQKKHHTISSETKVERTYIGCWNVGSLRKPTNFSFKLKNVIETIKLKNLSLLAMSEVQCVGSDILEVDETTVLFSELPEKKDGNQRGVVVALWGNLRTAWKEEGTHKMIFERIKVNRNYLNFIAVYAPTLLTWCRNRVWKFLRGLTTADRWVKQERLTIVLGNFNTRVGPLNISSRLHGPQNADVRNRNETRLVEFCNSNGLIITNTIFPHKKYISGRGTTQTRMEAMFLIISLSATNIDPEYMRQKAGKKQFIYQTII